MFYTTNNKRLIIAAICTFYLVDLASSVIHVQPSTGRATLVPGQRLQLQCDMLEQKSPEFMWYRRPLAPGSEEMRIEPDDENFDLRNTRLIIPRPDIRLAGDYSCKAKRDTSSSGTNETSGLLLDSSQSEESAIIKVRAMPFIGDFGVDTSHTGESTVISEGETLELNCGVLGEQAPLNITWLRSASPDDERNMIAIPDNNNNNKLAAPVAGQGGAWSELLLQPASPPMSSIAAGYVAQEEAGSVKVESVGFNQKRLTIREIRHEHRGLYLCMARNGVTEIAKRQVLVRIKDRAAFVWPLVGIVSELFILFTIIKIWETQRAQRELLKPSGSATGASQHQQQHQQQQQQQQQRRQMRQPAAGPSSAGVAVETQPLTLSS